MATSRRLRRLTRAGVTAAAVMLAVAVVPILSDGPTAGAADAKSIRVTSGNVITDPGTGQPTVVLSMYEDSLCPYCRRFEHTFGATVDKLIDTGAVAADYYMVAILDRPDRDYSSRAGAAAYCVADQSTDAFRRFKTALYANQPAESAASFPDNAALIDTARQAGAGDAVAACINSGIYTAMVAGMADATNVTHTPTVRINGQDYDPTTPDALVAKIKQLVGDVPGLDAPPTQTPPPGALAPFVGTWEKHQQRLRIDSAGTGNWTYQDLRACPNCSSADAPAGSLTFKLTSVTNGVATGSVTASADDQTGAVGDPVTAMIVPGYQGQGVNLRVTIGLSTEAVLCNSTSVGQCGA